MSIWGCLPLILFLILLALLPLVFGQLFATALMKLRLEPFHPCKHNGVAPLLQDGADFPISLRWTGE